jgi:predicted AlkP superfamily pyrophosphatase or phosphodiesterase
MPFPDYQGASIANLMASLQQGLGGRTTLPPLSLLEPERLSSARTVVLMVIDGLGWEYLQGKPGTALHNACRGRLTSVFPSTTASAITTFLTGLPPSQHGLTGWHMYLQELGAVAAVLPFRLRGAGGVSVGIDPSLVFDRPSLFSTLPVESHVISPERIVHSTFNVRHSTSARRHGYRDLDGFVERIVQLIRGQRPADTRRFVYAYWADFDGLAHVHGIGSAAVADHFAVLDAAFAQLLQALAGTDAMLMVTADHGFIDTAPGRVIELDEHPSLAECLALPLCGEPRLAYCYLRPGRTAAFTDYVREHLAEACNLWPADEVLRQGWFGPGPVHPQLGRRIGDYVLEMRENYVIRDFLAGENRFYPIGNHGGSSSAEMYVPLIVAEEGAA